MSTDAGQPLQLAFVGIGQALVTLSQSFALLAYKRALTPLYSSIPASSYIPHATVISAVLGSVVEVPTNVAALVYGSLLALAPNTVYYVGKYTGRWKDPVLGPIVTHIIVLVPIIVSGVALLQSVPHKDAESLLTRVLRLPFMLFMLPSLEPLWNSWGKLRTIPAAEIFFALAVAVLSYWVGCAYARENEQPKIADKPAPKDKGKGKDEKPKEAPVPAPAKSRVRKFPNISPSMAGFILTLFVCSSYHFSPPIHPHFRTGRLKAPYKDPSGNVTILSSTQSTTGVIVVGETSRGSDPHSGIRYLRASHSLLGGVWVGGRAATMDSTQSVYDAAGTRLGDSIYTAFVLQEAVKQIDSTSRGDDWHGSEALIIGLGTGSVATALKSNGLGTTIVEIDPAVYDAARTYFGLPDPGEGRVFLQDARKFTWRWRRNLELGDNLRKFDTVIHDVFSGGGVPGHLFTVEFWEDLKYIMKDDGVVVVNFAGKAGSKSSKAILSTLLHVFGQCRAFYDATQELSEDKLKSEFLNIVFFCTPVPEKVKPLTFRTSRGDDYLASYLRQYVFQSMSRREVKFETILGRKNRIRNSKAQVLLTDENNPLPAWQDEDASYHWKLMKEVLPNIYWETF